jgi:hypothetical protein
MVLSFFTTARAVVIMNNMKAVEIINRRIPFAQNCFAQVVVWRLSTPLTGSAHPWKYRLAYVADEVCVLRYDNEAGKGDHRHVGGAQSGYVFTDLSRLLSDFESEIERWNHENRHH